MNSKPPTPKRGAFPTPKEVRDKAPKYNPDAPDAADNQEGKETNSSPDQQRHEDAQGGTKGDAMEPKRK
jgi:hypothetical protein